MIARAGAGKPRGTAACAGGRARGLRKNPSTTPRINREFVMGTSGLEPATSRV
jgi:hypothetical protein